MIKLEPVKHFCTLCLGSQVRSLPLPRYSSTHFPLSRFLSGDPSTFASITELQYDRIVKRCKGEFDKDTIPPKFPL